MKTLVLIMLCLCGLVLHFLMHWWEAWRVEGPMSPVAFGRRSIPMWLIAIFSSVTCMLMLTNMPAFFGLSEPVSPMVEPLLQAFAFCAGYMGSSIVVRIARVIGHKIGHEDCDK